MQQLHKHRIEISDIYNSAKRKNSSLPEKTIKKAIEICLANPIDNLGKTIFSFEDAVYYRANQMWLAGCYR